jgi:CO dehydrogenase nickel-insertion accessory protein CooC1
MTKASSNGSGATSIHISLESKGGVGKSLMSTILSQYLLSKGQNVQGIIDADPVNQHTCRIPGIACEPAESTERRKCGPT